jgi:two-component system, OmpR family, phosphate regulon response regulator PhoB
MTLLCRTGKMTGSSHNPFVLVVEDDDSIALALAYVLDREGWLSARIASGAEAMERIRRDRPDLVLLDVMLPEVSGHDICRAVRADPGLGGVRILLMTAGSRMEADGEAHGFLSKPFELKALRDEMHRVLAA